MTKFTGRNGYFNASGLCVENWKHANSICIAPITGKGEVGNCDIQIPKADIPAVIDALQKYL